MIEKTEEAKENVRWKAKEIKSKKITFECMLYENLMVGRKVGSKNKHHGLTTHHFQYNANAM